MFARGRFRSQRRRNPLQAFVSASKLLRSADSLRMGSAPVARRAAPMTGSWSTPRVTVRRSRRLQDTILAAVHRACDDGQLELAGKLLRVGEESMAAEADLRRRRQDLWGLIAAHERLWYLRHED